MYTNLRIEGRREFTLLHLHFVSAACVGRAVRVLILITVRPAAPDQTKRKVDLAGADTRFRAIGDQTKKKDDLAGTDVAIPRDRRHKGVDIYDKDPNGGSKHWSDKQKMRLFWCVIPRGFRHDKTNLNPRAGPSSMFDEHDDDHSRPGIFGNDGSGGPDHGDTLHYWHLQDGPITINAHLAYHLALPTPEPCPAVRAPSFSWSLSHSNLPSPSALPFTNALAHKLNAALAATCYSGELAWLHLDTKTQVAAEYIILSRNHQLCISTRTLRTRLQVTFSYLLPRQLFAYS
ncbi:hypothetical protein PUNSTDRAFT_137657 [Punctularia strigosozonata HHB-11173 SS5]|uniref:uncharacterized protein n=1 Tax=Punctularia strigosozonata (strain HHB-11173) TaxID=741275 RepID=UPI00044186BE|nr:uncharacterized protein PUNSTDRAFT_137657 [Punctularia strigosozonata HHB-11173 SS5]EIN05549.1 hypothetical protein PUNSTDRAFT_137657 [Punctularia strigosozonata HHB-11173 SS5]